MRRIFKYGVLVIFVTIALFLCVESLLPGSISSQHSSDVGNIVDKPVNKIVEPTDIKLTAFDGELNKDVFVGQSVLLYPVFSPANTSETSVEYFVSDDKIACVQDDTVTFNAVGVVTLTVTSEYDNSLSDAFTFVVSEVPVKSISIQLDTLSVGERAYLPAEIMPHNATNKEYTLHCGSDIVIIDGKTVIGAKKGVATIVAVSDQNENIKCEIQVTVTATEAKELRFFRGSEIMTELSIDQGETKEISFEILPHDVTDRQLTWEISDELNMSFTSASSFEIRCDTIGSFIIKALSSDRVIAVLPVNVTAVKATEIVAEIIIENERAEGEPTAYIGDSIKINSHTLPARSSGKVRYSASPAAGINIDENGVVTAEKAGTYTLTLLCDDIKKVMTLKIMEVEVTGISILLGDAPVNALTLATGEKLALSYRLITSPSDRLPQDTRVDWEIGDNARASVTDNGTICGISSGKTTLKCKHGASGKQTTVTLDVTDEETELIRDLYLTIDGIKYDESELIAIKTGKTYDVKFFTVRGDGSLTSDRTSVSVSDKTLDLSGEKLTATEKGEAQITIACGGASKTYDVGVTDVAVTDIEINAAHNVYYNDKFTLQTILHGENGDAPTNTLLSYCYDRTALGLIGDEFTAFRLGKTEIVVSCGEVKRSVEIDVVSNITNIEAHSGEVFVNRFAPIEIDPITTTGGAAPVKFAYRIVEGADKIDINGGMIKGLAAGKAKIEVRAIGTDLSAIADITVSDSLIEKLSVDALEYPTIGNSYKLNVSYFPSDASANKILYSVSDPAIASVSSDGVVKILKAGPFSITAAAQRGNAKATVKATARNVLNMSAVHEIGFAAFSGFNGFEAMGTMKQNTSARFSFEFGDDATYRKVTFVSSDPDIVSINDNVLTAKNAGEATVTMTYHDGSDAEKLSFTVHVKVQKQKLSDITGNWGYKIRKSLGHYGAFLVMGIFALLTFVLFIKNHYLAAALTFVSGFSIAGLTELLQMITPNRGPSISDVLLDFQGFCTSVVPILVCFFAYWLFFEKEKKDKSDASVKEEAQNEEKSDGETK